MSLHTKRSTCRLCGSLNMQKTIPLKPIPIGEHYFDTPEMQKDVRYPIDLYQCSDCNAVQTQDDIDNNFLWDGYTYFSSQTKGIVDHFGEFVDELMDTYNHSSFTKVFDIGSNDGTLLKHFQKKGLSVYGIDPSETVTEVAKKDGITTYLGLFSDNVISKFPLNKQQADIITAFNVFAHSQDMKGMIQGIKKMLTPEGIFCFEVQYFGDIIKKKLIGTIFHEHMIHYSINSAINFLEKNGLKLINFKRNNIQMGSIIFYATHKDSEYKVEPCVDELLRYEDEIGLTGNSWSVDFSDYIKKQYNIIQDLRSSWKKNNLTVYGFGAARSGPTLAIQYGLENCLESILDDHPSKCEKYGVFETIQVIPSDNLYSKKPDIVVILAWIHTKNIVKNNIKYLEQGGSFISLWPKVEVITLQNVDSWLENFGREINN